MAPRTRVKGKLMKIAAVVPPTVIMAAGRLIKVRAPPCSIIAKERRNNPDKMPKKVVIE